MCRCDLMPRNAKTPSRRVRWWLLTGLAFAAFLAAALAAKAADAPLPAGLKPGDDVPGPFRPWAFTGKHLETQKRRVLATIRDNDPDAIKELKKELAKDLKGSFHCPVSEHGLDPLVLVFVKGTDPSPGLLQLLQKLDEAVTRHERERLACAVVFLDSGIMDVARDHDKRTAAADALEPKLNPLKNLTASVDAYEGVQKQYKLNPEADVTVIMHDRLKVISARALLNAGLDDKGIEAVLKDVDALLDASKKAALPASSPPK